jgi:hypothetical protein
MLHFIRERPRVSARGLCFFWMKNEIEKRPNGEWISTTPSNIGVRNNVETFHLRPQIFPEKPTAFQQ